MAAISNSLAVSFFSCSAAIRTRIAAALEAATAAVSSSFLRVSFLRAAAASALLKTLCRGDFKSGEAPRRETGGVILPFAGFFPRLLCAPAGPTSVAGEAIGITPGVKPGTNPWVFIFE